MTKVVLMLLTVLVAVMGQAGWESWLKTSIYRASCENYDCGEDLSNEKDVKGGLWEYPVIPAGAVAKAAAEKGHWQYIDFSTGETGLVFSPDDIGDRPVKSVVTSMFLVGYEKYPETLVGARGAFALYVPEDGEPSFLGWTAGGWRALKNASISPVPSQWYDVSMKFLQRQDGSVYVQYRLKRQSDESFVTLYAAEDESETKFLAGSGLSEAIVTKVEFRGEGAFRYISGSEPRRGILISLVPWREMLIDESVDRHETGEWYAYDYDAEQWIQYPAKDGDAYVIDVPEGENYTGFHPTKGQQESEGSEVVEFSVRFLEANDNDATPDDVCALVRVVEEESSFDVRNVNLRYRFACLVNGGWYINKDLWADVNADYTVEVALDKKNGMVSYGIRKGRGTESGAYQSLVPFPVEIPIGDPLFTFFGGVGRVYSIKASGQIAQ